MSVPVAMDVETTATILLPYFDAVRDHFFEHELPDGSKLEKLRRVRLVVTDIARARGPVPPPDECPMASRHFMGCSYDGTRVFVAHDTVYLPPETIVSMMAHEFGHAADAIYPGRWLFRDRSKPATWIRNDDRRRQSILNLWNNRSDDQVEWSADAIAYAVTGKKVVYVGNCMLQSFDRGRARPEGLR